MTMIEQAVQDKIIEMLDALYKAEPMWKTHWWNALDKRWEPLTISFSYPEPTGELYISPRLSIATTSTNWK